jgi:hypothetical protein
MYSSPDGWSTIIIIIIIVSSQKTAAMWESSGDTDETVVWSALLTREKPVYRETSVPNCGAAVPRSFPSGRSQTVIRVIGMLGSGMIKRRGDTKQGHDAQK